MLIFPLSNLCTLTGISRIMDSRNPLAFYFVLLFWLTSMSALATEQNKSINNTINKNMDASTMVGNGSVPEWVDPVSIPTDYQIPHNTIQDGTYFLLVDEQTILMNDENQGQTTQTHKSYNRYVTHIVNQKGIEYNAQVEISFDPVYEQVILHQLNVIRDGQVIDKLQETDFSVLHNEEQLDTQLYNGERKLHGIISDLRTNDILDYSYSKIGANPVFSGAFAEGRVFQWTIPIEKLQMRYFIPADTKLQVSIINSQLQLQESTVGAYKKYLLEQNQLPPLYVDDDYPHWYSAYPRLMMSTRESWQEVVQWGVNLFDEPLKQSSAQIDNLVQDIRAKSASSEDQIMAAVQFVQNEVRYFGIELGENSHRPSLAAETLERRYGDCKDKSVLLINILRNLGFEADPVLVHSDSLARITQTVPSERWFDHAIVRLRYQEQDYWIDPTREMQFGQLDSFHQVDFGHALVLKEGETQLQKMEPPVLAELVTTDVWDLTDGKDAPARFITENMFIGLEADKQRNRIAADGVKSIQTSYIEHFQNYYKSIKQEGEMDIVDDRQINQILISQAYTVPDFWKEDEEGFNTKFYSEGINYLLNEPEDLDRTLPLAIRYPESTKQNILVYLHDIDWKFSEENEQISNEFFTFIYTVNFDAQQDVLKLSYSIETHQDHVPVDKLDEYVAALEAAREFKNYGIIEYKKQPPSSAAATPSTTDTATDEQSSSIQSDSSEWSDIWIEFKEFLIFSSIWILMFIAYIYMRRLDQKDEPYYGEMRFYPVSKIKFLALGLLTSGIYFQYWFYKNYQYEKSKYKRSVFPFIRAIFYLLFYYPLFRTLHQRLKGSQQHTENEKEHGSEQAPELPDFVIPFTVIVLAVNLASAVTDSWYMPALTLTAILLLPMLNLVTQANSDNRALSHNSQWHPRHLLLIFMFAPLSAYLLAYDLHLTPDTKIVQGDSLYEHDISFMVQNNIIQQNEEIAWFYSDAMIFIRDDGNGVTRNSVFSYWKDETGELIVDTATYEEIDDIKVDWSDEAYGQTIVEVIKHNGEEFWLYLSNEENLDKTFVQYLNKRLKPYR